MSDIVETPGSDRKIHPNVIIRKKLKSNAKLGKMLLEIHDETIAGCYPTMKHSDRLRKFGLHQYTWEDTFGGLTRKINGRVIVSIQKEEIELIAMATSIVGAYKILSHEHKKILETVILALIREK